MAVALKNRLEVQGEEGRLRVEYMYYAYEKDSTIRSSHVTRNHAFLNLVTCCLYVEGANRKFIISGFTMTVRTGKSFLAFTCL